MSRYKSGRQNGRPLESVEPRISGTITLSREEWDELESIGHGNRSKAVRELLASVTTQPDTPSTVQVVTKRIEKPQ